MCKLKHILSSPGEIAIKKSPVNYLEKKNTMVQFYSILVNSILYAFKMKYKSK